LSELTHNLTKPDFNPVILKLKIFFYKKTKQYFYNKKNIKSSWLNVISNPDPSLTIMAKNGCKPIMWSS